MKPYGIAHWDRNTVASGTDRFHLAIRRPAKKKARRPESANDYECYCGSIQPYCACDRQAEWEEDEGWRSCYDSKCDCAFCSPLWSAIVRERELAKVKLFDFLKVG